MSSLSALLLSLLGCAADYKAPEGESEGDCIDGIDNDDNGALDCLDEGCSDSPECTSTDTAAPTDADADRALIQSVEEPSCEDGLWRYELRTVGFADAAAFDILQTGVRVPWAEFHTMDLESTDATGAVWSVELDTVNSLADVVSGQTSVFQCDDTEPGRAATMTWRFRLLDSGGSQTDCLAIGDDPSYFPHCRDG
jgi:predicted secreted protein